MCLCVEGSLAAAARSSGASVAMVVIGDRPVLHFIQTLQVEHLIEVAIVDGAIPADADRVSAHEVLCRMGVEVVCEQAHVRF